MFVTVIAESMPLVTAASDPKLTIIVPVYNTGPYLKRCLDSVILPDPLSSEIIIVHDGGTDNSRDIAAQWIASNRSRIRARLLDQPNGGLSAARMTGLKQSSGKFVAFLDSDDIADVNVLCSAAAYAERQSCDVVLFRSQVLDDKTQRTEPFYDSWLWDKLVDGKKFRRTTLANEPRLLRLEPNANTRIIRRDFFDRAKIDFPIGLHFEDYPPHVKEMIAASAVGLLNEIGYFYRVNRPGKITDQRDRRRFDAIKSASLALAFAETADLPQAAIANLTLQITRLLSWCAECTPEEDRREFCQNVMVLAARIPDECYFHANLDFAEEPRERLILDIFRSRDEDALYRLASDPRHIQETCRSTPAEASIRPSVLKRLFRGPKFLNPRKWPSP